MAELEAARDAAQAEVQAAGRELEIARNEMSREKRGKFTGLGYGSHVEVSVDLPKGHYSARLYDSERGAEVASADFEVWGPGEKWAFDGQANAAVCRG